MPQDKRKPRSTKIIRIGLICIFAAIFIFSAVMLINTVLQYKDAENLYSKVHDDFMENLNKTTGTGSGADAKVEWTRPVETTPPEPSDTGTVTTPVTGTETTNGTPITEAPPETTAPVETPPSERFLNASEMIRNWQAKNSEVIGYIHIEFAPKVYIGYPLVRNDDNFYYTTRAYDKTDLKSGSIFLDSRCDPVISNNDVSLIFGHNMNDGSMFAKLTNFKKAEYFNNVNITIYTLEGIYTYKVFSVHNAKAGDDYTNVFFNNDAEYLVYLEKMQKLSYLSSNIKLTAADQVITLSTCLNTSVDARLAVHAVLISIER